MNSHIKTRAAVVVGVDNSNSTLIHALLIALTLETVNAQTRIMFQKGRSGLGWAMSLISALVTSMDTVHTFRRGLMSPLVLFSSISSGGVAENVLIC